MRRALAAGVPAARIIFSGVGKTRNELAAALDAGVGQFNVESEAELAALDEVARGKGKRAPTALRINPNIDAKTHSKITTGRKQDKFGIAYDRTEEVYARAARMAGIEPLGLAVHIGSQILSLDPYRRAFKRVATLAKKLRGAGLPVTRLDLGGGVGIVYRDEQTIALQDYADLVEENFGRIGCELAFEPGRAIAGPAGVLVSSVVYVKDGGMRPIAIVDAAMNDLIRPALYEAFHPIVPLRQPAAGAREQEIDVVGPVCESGDTFAQQRLLPDLAAGDTIAFGAAGAYGAAMASTYNSRLLVPEVLVDGDQFAVIRPRPSFDDMLRCDSMPGWLDDAPARLKRGAA
jgi:diaminopimelate decarboxylase